MKPEELRIVTHPHPSLSITCQEVDELNDDVLAYIDRLKYLLKSMPNGIGLAASQAGLDLRIYVAYDKLEKNEEGEIKAYINPSFKPDNAMDISLEEEGCLSFPGITGKVMRPRSGTLTYLNEEGKLVSESVSGLKCRCAQHEIDHLNGVSINSSMIEESKKKMAPRLKRLEKRYRN